MSFGIPLVTAGLTEDKADVNARVAWSGVGIDLATNEPTPQALREAIRTALDKPNYRLRASLMAEEVDAIDTRSQILRIVSQVLHRSDEDGLWRGEVEKNKTHLNVYPYPARAGSATAARGRRIQLAPPGMVPVLS